MEITNSQRIKLATAVRDVLGKEDWPYISTTLDTFGAPELEHWGGGEASAYVYQRVASLPSSLLIEIAEHFGYSLPGAMTPVSPAGPDHLRVFVSHISAHKVFAAEVQEELARYRIVAFIAHKDIEPTTEWQTEIEKQLLECDALVALLHDGFHSSLWTDQEMGFAMGRRVPTLAIHLGQPPYGFIGKFQAFGGHGKTAEQLAIELFNALRTNKQTQHRMAAVLVRLFVKSPSFAAAKARMGYLEMLDVWNADLAAELAEALDQNSQISDAIGVPYRVKKLLEKWGHPSTI